MHYYKQSEVSSIWWSSVILWGKLHESDVFNKYESEYFPENMKLDKTGIHIYPQKGFLAASPDGIVTNDSKVASIIEIKCPYSARNYLFIKRA